MHKLYRRSYITLHTKPLAEPKVPGKTQPYSQASGTGGHAVLSESAPAPSRFLNSLPIVVQVVHLGEEGPGGGGHEADQPD